MAQTDLNHMTRDEILTRLSYDPLTGHFHWVKSKRPGWEGKRAGYALNNGYRMISVDEHAVLEHRLAWFLMTGSWPAGEIDHDNRVRNDNRFANLKDGTKADNQANASLRKDSTSGVQGVHWSARADRWVARVQRNGKRHCVGYFKTIEEASAARQEKIRELSI